MTYSNRDGSPLSTGPLRPAERPSSAAGLYRLARGLAYRAGSLDKPTVKRFQEALLEGQHTALGRQLLTLWKITSLEPAPANFEETLEKTLKAYPPPKGLRAGHTLGSFRTVALAVETETAPVNKSFDISGTCFILRIAKLRILFPACGTRSGLLCERSKVVRPCPRGSPKSCRLRLK
jgi:hypothetical protein